VFFHNNGVALQGTGNASLVDSVFHDNTCDCKASGSCSTDVSDCANCSGAPNWVGSAEGWCD
jgi:hypothetical protein